MILAGTGHRPNKILWQGHNAYEPVVYQRLVRLASAALRYYRPSLVISGMALGWDQALADAAVALDIPFTAAIPFEGQEKQWSQSSQRKFQALREQASSVIIVCEGGYSPHKMQIRNQWICDHATDLLALWDGSPGGTANCIAYAQQKGVPIINVWEKWNA